MHCHHVALPSPYLLHVLANNSYFHSQTEKLWAWVHAVFNNDQSGESSHVQVDIKPRGMQLTVIEHRPPSKLRKELLE